VQYRDWAFAVLEQMVCALLDTTLAEQITMANVNLSIYGLHFESTNQFTASS
jgi:hypothetical protein